MRLKHQRCASNFNHSSFLVVFWNQAKRHLRTPKAFPNIGSIYQHVPRAHVRSPGLNARQGNMEPLSQDKRVSCPGQP